MTTKDKVRLSQLLAAVRTAEKDFEAFKTYEMAVNLQQARNNFELRRKMQLSVVEDDQENL